MPASADWTIMTGNTFWPEGVKYSNTLRAKIFRYQPGLNWPGHRSSGGVYLADSRHLSVHRAEALVRKIGRERA